MRIAVVIVVVMVLWWGLAVSGLLPPFVLPNPISVLVEFRESLLVGAGSTLARTLIGFMTGVLLAHTILYLCTRARDLMLIEGQLAASRAIPMIAMLPLFVIWFGFGELSRLLLIALTTLVFLATPLVSTMRHIPIKWQSLRQSRFDNDFQYFRHVIVPATFGENLGAYRVGIAIAFTISIASDYLGAVNGLGRFIETSRITYNIPALFLAVLVSALCGFLLDRGIVGIHRAVVHWGGRAAKV